MRPSSLRRLTLLHGTSSTIASVVVLLVACTSVTHTDSTASKSTVGGTGGTTAEGSSAGVAGEGLAGDASTSLSATGGASDVAGGNGSSGAGQAGSGAAAGGGAAGGAGGNPVGGAAGAAPCDAGASLAPDLHAACIEDLGGGRLRFHYDFANATQQQDWVPSTAATLAVRQNALIVTSALTDIGVALFRRKLHVDKLSFNVTLLSGNTTNWYINTIWSGSWNPDAGYGGYHDNTGRGFIINGTEYNPADVVPLSVGVLRDAVIAQSDTEIRWEQGGTPITEHVAPLPITDRILAIGAWQSSAAYYNVVFEGTLN